MPPPGESGQALPLALVVLGLSGIVVAPFLAHAGTGLISLGIHRASTDAAYSADAGIEHAIWRLTNDGLADQLPDPGDSTSYQLSQKVNGAAPNIAVTLLSTGGQIGQIDDQVVDELEFDTLYARTPAIVEVSGDVYAIAYNGPGGDGFVRTVRVAADGQMADSIIDSLEFDTASGGAPSIINVAGNIFAVAYQGPGDDGFLKTIQIAADGDLGNSAIDTLEFDTTQGKAPSLARVADSVLAIAYQGADGDGFLRTVEVSGEGVITDSIIDTLEFDTKQGKTPDILGTGGGIFAIAYQGRAGDGFLQTIEIAADGQIADGSIDKLEFDNKSGKTPRIVKVAASADVYAIVYRGPGGDGFLKTVQITADGDMGSSAIDTLEFDTSTAKTPSILHVNSNVYAIAYRDPGDDGRLVTAEIMPDGQITDTLIDTLAFDTGRAAEPHLVNVSGNTYAVAYSGPGGDDGEHEDDDDDDEHEDDEHEDDDDEHEGGDGFLKTVSIVSSAAETYQIVSAAEGTTITVRLEITDGSVKIVSWRITLN